MLWNVEIVLFSMLSTQCMHMVEGGRYLKLYDYGFLLDYIACSDVHSALDEYIIIVRTHWRMVYYL